MTQGDVTLRPLRNHPEAPSLVFRDGQVRCADEAWPATGLALASYHTRVPNPRTRGLLREGWRLKGPDGSVLVWLSNLDEPAYGAGDIVAFAASAGIQVVDDGLVPHSELTATGNEVRRGPGTGVLSAVVAPLRQWLLILPLAAGVAWSVPVFIRSQQVGSLGALALIALGILVVLVPFFLLGVFITLCARWVSRGAQATAEAQHATHRTVPSKGHGSAWPIVVMLGIASAVVAVLELPSDHTSTPGLWGAGFAVTVAAAGLYAASQRFAPPGSGL